MMRVTGAATTVLLGRKNYQGFGSLWPAVATDDNADPRDRTFAQWLNTLEKIAFSTTLTDDPWENSRSTNADPAEVVRQLRQRPPLDRPPAAELAIADKFRESAHRPAALATARTAALT